MKDNDGFILVRFTREQLDQVRCLSTTEGFCQAFEKNLRVTRTFTEAYEITEASHEQLFGRRRYSCYESFSIVKSRIKH